MSDYVKPGVLSGSVQEMVDKVGAYVAAGAQWVILAMRAPFDRDGLERFAAEVIPAGARLISAARGSRHMSQSGGPSSGICDRARAPRSRGARRTRRCVPSCSRGTRGFPRRRTRRAPAAARPTRDPRPGAADRCRDPAGRSAARSGRCARIASSAARKRVVGVAEQVEDRRHRLGGLAVDLERPGRHPERRARKRRVGVRLAARHARIPAQQREHLLENRQPRRRRRAAPTPAADRRRTPAPAPRDRRAVVDRHLANLVLPAHGSGERSMLQVWRRDGQLRRRSRDRRAARCVSTRSPATG